MGAVILGNMRGTDAIPPEMMSSWSMGRMIFSPPTRLSQLILFSDSTVVEIRSVLSRCAVVNPLTNDLMADG